MYIVNLEYLRTFFSLFFCLLFSIVGCAQSVKVSSFGFDNPSLALHLAIESEFDTIIVDKKAVPWSVKPIKLSNINSKVIVLESGVEVIAQRGAYPKTTDALFSFNDCNNITIIGNGAKFCMNKDEYLKGEWRHGISIRGSKNITIRDLTVRDTGGDGIYIAGSKSNSYSENILINYVKALNNKRQGISIISGKNIQIKNCLLAETSGTLPGAGLDIEPNRPQDIIEQINITDCVLKNNYGPGIKIALDKLKAESRAISISVKNCILADNHSPDNPRVAAELVFGANKSSPVKGKVVFDSCLVKSSNWGLMYSRKRADAYLVELKNFKAMAMGKKGSMPIIYLEVTDYYKDEGPLGGFMVDDLYVESKSSIPLITVRGSRLGTLGSLKDVFANITYEGDFNPIEYIKYNPSYNENVKLELTKKF